MFNIIHYFPFSTSQWDEHIRLAEADGIRSEIVWHRFFTVRAFIRRFRSYIPIRKLFLQTSPISPAGSVAVCASGKALIS